MVRILFRYNIEQCQFKTKSLMTHFLSLTVHLFCLDINTRLLFRTEEELISEVEFAIPHIWTEHKYRNAEDRNAHSVASRRLKQKSMFYKEIMADDIKQLVFDAIWNPTCKMVKEVDPATKEISFLILKR